MYVNGLQIFVWKFAIELVKTVQSIYMFREEYRKLVFYRYLGAAVNVYSLLLPQLHKLQITK